MVRKIARVDKMPDYAVMSGKKKFRGELIYDTFQKVQKKCHCSKKGESQSMKNMKGAGAFFSQLYCQLFTMTLAGLSSLSLSL